MNVTPPPAKGLIRFNGKRQPPTTSIVRHLRRFIPAAFGDYYEPFVGSGAVFFELASSGLLRNRRAWLLDTNLDLIGCYRAVAWQVEEVIEHLRRLEHGHRRVGVHREQRSLARRSDAGPRVRCGAVPR